MKKAKTALTFIAILGIIGGALAFKSQRILRTLYAYTTTICAGQITGGCFIKTNLFYTTNPVGV
jgi:hypothetical protein